MMQHSHNVEMWRFQRMTDGGDATKGTNGHAPVRGAPTGLSAPPTLVGSTAAPTLHPSVFPIKAIVEFPSDLSTADCGFIATAEDGCQYALKDGTSKNSAPIVPHCEWFCSQLAVAVHIATPQHFVVEKLDGTLVFGSQWLGGVFSPASAKTWQDMVADGTIPLVDVIPTLSHVYAFDQFVCNEDRHAQNFLAFRQHTKVAIHAFDYSRAWLTRGFPLPSVPLMRTCNTVLQHSLFVASWGTEYIDANEVDITLEKIRNIPASKIRRIIDQHPQRWLTIPQRDAILSWWGSPMMLSRLNDISTGVRNGNCF